MPANHEVVVHVEAGSGTSTAAGSKLTQQHLTVRVVDLGQYPGSVAAPVEVVWVIRAGP